MTEDSSFPWRTKRGRRSETPWLTRVLSSFVFLDTMRFGVPLVFPRRSLSLVRGGNSLK